MDSICWDVARIHDLTTQALYDIMALRQEVFVVEQDCAYLDADGRDLSALWVQGYAGDELVAHARVLPPGVSYPEPSIGRVVVSARHRGRQIGQRLMRTSLRALADHFGTASCRISAQTYLIPFYSRFGFRVTGPEYLEDGLPHREMYRTEDDPLQGHE